MIDWSDLTRLRTVDDKKIVFVKKQPNGRFYFVYENIDGSLDCALSYDDGAVTPYGRKLIKMLPRTRKFFAVAFENGVCVETFFSEQSAESAGEKGMKSGLGRYVIQEFDVEVPEDWT